MSSIHEYIICILYLKNIIYVHRNLSRMCQIPVINPIRNNDNSTEFDDPSEPIYTDPSLFERSR